MLRQMLAIITVGIAQSTDADQRGGFATPNARRNSFTGPAEGKNSIFHTTATATKEAT